MTVLGEFLSKKSIKKADVSRKTGISTSRLSELSALNNPSNIEQQEASKLLFDMKNEMTLILK
jgi:DNA-binding Xre family transcriptional regulator